MPMDLPAISSRSSSGPSKAPGTSPNGCASTCWNWPSTDTPWYPTVRLIRQTTTGAWGDVMAKAAAAVQS